MPRAIPELVIRDESNTFADGIKVMPLTWYPGCSTSTAATRLQPRRQNAARPRQFWRSLPKYRRRSAF